MKNIPVLTVADNHAEAPAGEPSAKRQPGRPAGTLQTGRPTGSMSLTTARHVVKQCGLIYGRARLDWLRPGSKLQPDQVRALCAVLDLTLRARELELVETHIKGLEDRLGGVKATLGLRITDSQSDGLSLKSIEGQGLPSA